MRRRQGVMYLLDAAGVPRLTNDILAFEQQMNDPDSRQVAVDEIGSVLVSTAFIGLDMNFYGGMPLLWETSVLSPVRTTVAMRYDSRAAAVQGHANIVAAVSRGSEDGT